MSATCEPSMSATRRPYPDRGSPGRTNGNAGSKPAHQSLITDVSRPRSLPCTIRAFPRTTATAARPRPTLPAPIDLGHQNLHLDPTHEINRDRTYPRPRGLCHTAATSAQPRGAIARRLESAGRGRSVGPAHRDPVIRGRLGTHRSRSQEPRFGAGRGVSLPLDYPSQAPAPCSLGLAANPRAKCRCGDEGVW